jgi:hypothetical protein
MSLLETPERVYGTDVPAATFVVVSVKVAVEPSFAEELLDVTKYVAAADALVS